MTSNRLKTRIGSLFLVLLLIGSGLLLAFHHHEAAAKDPEHCATCHLGQQTKLGNPEAGSSAILSPVIFQESSLPEISPLVDASGLLLGKSSQAPPRSFFV